MNLTLVTHTSVGRPGLTRCISEVGALLTSEMTHQVLTTKSYDEWVTSRFEVTQSSEYVAFIDDDDIPLPGLLTAWEAMKQTQVGIVCAPEIRVYPTLQDQTSFTKDYDKCRLTPLELHHLCIINTKYVRPDILNIAATLPNRVGVEWMVKTSAALTGGALVVPEPGYMWDVTSYYGKNTHRRFTTNSLNAVTSVLKTWQSPFTGKIPILERTI